LDQKTISKVTTCIIQLSLLVNTINVQPCIQHINRRSFQVDKVSEHETDQSSPSRTEVKNLWSYTSPNAFRTSTGTTLSLYCHLLNFSLHSFKHKDKVKDEKQKNWFRPTMLATTKHLVLRKIIKKKNLRTPDLIFCITY